MMGLNRYSALALAALCAAPPSTGPVRRTAGVVRVLERSKPKPKARSEMSPTELRCVRAAEAKRERRRLRNARVEAELGNHPEGVRKCGDDWMAECRRCGGDYELPCEIGEFNPDMSYCGGSDRCCP